MKTISARFIVLCSLLLSALALHGKEYIKLTSPDGRQIEAAIIDVHRDWVTIELKASGQEMRTEMHRFSAASQKLIQEWQEAEAIAKGLEFGISSKTFDTKKGSSLASSWKNTEAGYSIRVTNNSNVTVKGLKLRYLIVVKREQMGRRNDKDHRLETVQGALDIALVPGRETVKLETDPILLREQWMNSGYSLLGGGMEESEDELEGIITEFFHDGKLIKKESKPSSLAKDYTLQAVNSVNTKRK